jgi:hemoglobin
MNQAENERRDIENRTDLEQVLIAFYDTALRDDRIGHFFTTVVPINLQTHIPVIAGFWESVVLGTQGYRKNVMEVHQHIHRLMPIQKSHLDRWVEIFTQTIDEHFAGPNAETMKQRGRSIATLMDIKLNHSGINKR